MADLKTRKAVKGTVKTIDRAAVAAERLKSAAVRTKNAAERSATPAETSSQEYGAQKLERTAQNTVSELDFQFRKRGAVAFLMHGEMRTRQGHKCKNAGTYWEKTSRRKRCRLLIRPSPQKRCGQVLAPCSGPAASS